MFSDIGELRAQIRAFNLQRIEDQLINLAKPSLQMTRTLIDEDALAAGASKLGGHPDVPIGFVWPYWGEKPLTFIGQFNFAEIASVASSDSLPKRGVLYFFYEADEVLERRTDDRDGWRLIYVQDDMQRLSRIAHPTYPGKWCEIKALKPHHVRFSPVLTLPTIFWVDQLNYEIEFKTLSEQTSSAGSDEVQSPEHRAYWKLRDASAPPPHHYWFGHPWRWQDQVEWEVVTESQQITPQRDETDNLFRYTDEQLTHIRSQITHWQFLFQIDSDSSLGVSFADDGTLYICIPKDRLARRQFDACWTVMQST